MRSGERGGPQAQGLRPRPIWVCSRSDSDYDRPSHEGGPYPTPEVVALERHARGVTRQTFGYDTYTRLLGDVVLSDGSNLNQELVKQG